MQTDENGKLALILWRLDSLEKMHQDMSRWRRQVMAGVVIAVAVPSVQLIVNTTQSTTGA